MRSNPRDDVTQLRRRIAVEAARLIAEQGLRDFHLAKRKAALNLGLGDSSPLPRNTEIEEALREHQRLFQGHIQPAQLHELRETAIEAMGFFKRFQPRLVGAVLEGTADAGSAICLHLFHDNFAEVIAFLDENRIPFEQQDRELRYSADMRERYPALLFSAGGTAIDVTVFALDGLRRAPLDRISERPMRRATLESVQALTR
ncbi:MAG: hypothetical protein IPP82_03745 [Xanthomonadales bacterium]|nr:hypothetical protein [Xanthomonadales bacterium]